MTRDELLARFRAREDTLTELKTTPHESHVKRALVAFANSAGPERPGVLFLGARPDGTAVGVQDPTKLGEKVAAWAAECYPPIRFDCVTLPVDGHDLLAVVVPASPERPHFAAPAYVRDGPKTVKAPPAFYDELIASRNTKAGAILRQKGRPITVLSGLNVGAWGTGQPSAAGGRRYECEVVSCTAHSVELYHPGSGRTISFSLERVEVTADPEHHRPLRLVLRR